MLKQTLPLLLETLSDYPVACAHVTGSSQIEDLIGDVWLYPLEGTLVVADIQGIPFRILRFPYSSARPLHTRRRLYWVFKCRVTLFPYTTAASVPCRRSSAAYGLLRPCIYDSIYRQICAAGGFRPRNDYSSMAGRFPLTAGR